MLIHVVLALFRSCSLTSNPAPPLEGIGLTELPQQLTGAYASIVAARMRLRESSDQDAPLNEIADVKRLPVGVSQEGDTDAPARQLLGRSFAAYRARAKGDEQWLQTRIDAALRLRHADPEKPSELTWAGRLAATVAVPVDFIREVSSAFNARASRSMLLFQANSFRYRVAASQAGRKQCPGGRWGSALDTA